MGNFCTFCFPVIATIFGPAVGPPCSTAAPHTTGGLCLPLDPVLEPVLREIWGSLGNLSDKEEFNICSLDLGCFFGCTHSGVVLLNGSLVVGGSIPPCISEYTGCAFP